MKKVAILYICTGKYIVFWEKFYTSSKQHLLLNTEKHYFVFTDVESLPIGEDDPKVHRIYQENLGWPGNTLYRFAMFRKIEKQLEEFDYIYFFNANYVCMKDISEEEFLPIKDELVVTRHPGYYYTRPSELPYDRNPKSTAYISYLDPRSLYYFCGGLNGGGCKSYLNLINEIDRRIKKDDANGVVALWHDESHLDKYMLKQTRYKMLSPAYAYPEDRELFFEQKLLLLEKEKVFDMSYKILTAQGQINLNPLLRFFVEKFDSVKMLFHRSDEFI